MKDLSMEAQWAARKESRDDCAKRLSAFMGDLAALHPRLSAWGKASGSPKKPRLRIEPTPDGVAAALSSHKKDFPRGEPWPEAGFMLVCYTEVMAEEGVVDLHASVGAYTPYGPNFVELKMWEPVIAEAELWKQIALAAIDRFDPDTTVVTNSAYLQDAGVGSSHEPTGWFTYECGKELKQHSLLPLGLE